MGTRSYIITANPKGDFTGIYCHWDGYPSHNGKILHENYDTQEKVETLIALGDLSSLRESPACPEGHSYRTPVAGHCIAYGRDRGEAVAAEGGAEGELERSGGVGGDRRALVEKLDGSHGPRRAVGVQVARGDGDIDRRSRTENRAARG